MKYFVLFLLMLNFVSIVAGCENSQIDINSASAEDLEELDGIGSVKAQAIIDTRPFNSVDDLIKVYGIGEKTLEKIKLQSLACVENENGEVDEKLDEKTKISEDNSLVEENSKTNIILAPQKEDIVLNSVIENSEEVVYESKNFKILKYSPYAFSVFLIFVIVVLLFDK
ncbi:helix-hairpin-helix domain-containing protein [Candidatus Pacearchaeota archaeon]|nr:helix-hairpin-helix domain-containing protein [Candidatus Pacearchaeota archaeon]